MRPIPGNFSDHPSEMNAAGILVFVFAVIWAGQAQKFTPKNVLCLPTSNSLKITWEKPSDGPAYLYEVTIDGGDLRKTQMLFSDVYEYTLSEGILPATDYRVDVTAIPLVGESATETRICPTWPGVPEMPEITSVTYNGGKSQIKITWSQPKVNGRLKGYEVNFTSDGKIIETKNIDSRAERMAISKELPNGSYYVDLCAEAISTTRNSGNGGGKGQVNRVGPIAIPPVTANIPLQPTEVNPGAIHLQWDFSKTETACGIYSNTIFYNNGTHTKKVVLIPPSNQHILTNLDQGAKYTFIVTADCIGSLGAVTMEAQVTPKQYPPSMPENLNVQVTSAGLEISWNPPATPNGKILKYTVSVNGGPPDEVLELNFTYSSTKPQTPYTVTVKAHNAAGEGPAASMTVTTAPDASVLPGTPTEFNADLKSPTAALLTWLAPKMTPVQITGYVLSFKPKGGDLKSVTINGNKLEYFLTGLESASEYDLELRASSQYINGEPAVTTLSTFVPVPPLPTNIQAKQVSDQEVLVTWDPPAATRNEQTKKEMIVRSFVGENLQGGLFVAPVTAGKVTVNGIKEDTVVKLTAQLKIYGPLGGFSKVKELPEIITWGPALVPPEKIDVQIKRLNSISVSWTDTANQGKNPKYQVRVTPTVLRTSQVIVTFNKEVDVDSLETFTEYKVDVGTMRKPNQNGEGEAPGNMTSTTIKTWPGPGGVPTDLKAEATNTTVTIHWQKPLKQNGELMYYAVTVRTIDGLDIYKGKPINGLTCTLDNLVPFKWHLIEVRTRNKPATTDIQGISGGLGEAVTTKVETWPGGVFEPTKGKLEVLSPGMVTVTWSAPQGLYGIVQEYYVLVKVNDNLERKETVLPPTTSITLTMLPANYKIYVQAKIAPNSQGMGGGLSREVLIEETTGSSVGDGGNGGSGGLSGGAIAGIVIGVIVAILLLVFIVLFLTKRRSENVMVDDWQWSESGGYSFFNEDVDMEMGAIGRDAVSMVDNGSDLAF